MTQFRVTDVSFARATDTGVEHGIDVDFTLELDGTEHEGEVTLAPNADGRPGYSAWGQPDHWLDGRTVALLRDLDDGDYTDVLKAIEAATAERASLFASDAQPRA